MVPSIDTGPVPADQPLRTAPRRSCLGFCLRPGDGPLFSYLWDKYFPGWDLGAVECLFADGEGLSVIGRLDDGPLYTIPWLATPPDPATL